MEPKRSVLVVDGDVSLLKMAEELIRERYAVSLEKSGEQAVQLLHKVFVPDLVLPDIDMPGMSGYATIEAARQVPGAEDIPVVFLTGLTETEAELKGLRAGASNYITKPFDRQILLARLIVLGYSNREICTEFHYSYAYVKKAACVVFHKLDVSKRSELRTLFCG